MAFEQWPWLLRFYTLLAAQYNIVPRLVMSGIIILLHDESGDEAVFMPDTLLLPSLSHNAAFPFRIKLLVHPWSGFFKSLVRRV